MIEVEVKLPIEEKETYECKLLSLGYVNTAKLKETDCYYTSTFHDFRKKDEALRIRETVNLLTENRESFVTYKGKKLDKISMARTELETGVDKPEILKQIFETIGFKPVPLVEKTRTEYVKDNVTVCLDEVTNLGSFMEVEILVEKQEKRKEALDAIGNILKSLGLDMKDTVTTSYLSMIENKTDLYDRIYETVRRIPAGRVATYKTVALALGNEHYARVVGNALHINPKPGIIPCHRVVNAKGMLASNFGFGGPEGQRSRLMAEGVDVTDNRVNLKKYGIDSL